MLNLEYLHVFKDCNILLPISFFDERLIEIRNLNDKWTPLEADVHRDRSSGWQTPAYHSLVLAAARLKERGEPGHRRREHFTRKSDEYDGGDAPPPAGVGSSGPWRFYRI